MAGLSPLFTTSETVSIEGVTLTLPDPELIPGSSYMRAGVARFASSKLHMARVTAPAPITLSSPAMATVRYIDLDPAQPDTQRLNNDGVSTLIEINPLPFFIAPVLRQLKSGVPSFYVGLSSSIPLSENDTVNEGQTLGSASTFYIGAMFQDGLSMEPWGWASMISGAIPGNTPWQQFISRLYPNETRVFKILDHTGTPVASARFQVITAAQTQTVLSNAEGILNLSFSLGQDIEMEWMGSPRDPGATSLPVIALYESSDSAHPENSINIPASQNKGNIMILELANWLAPPTTGSAMKHYHIRSRIEPLVDGFKTFRMIAGDMINTIPSVPPPANDKPGVHFAGWGFKEFVLDKNLLDDEGKPFTYSKLVRHLRENESDVRLLVNKLFSVPGDLDDEVLMNVIVLLFILTDIVIILSVTGVIETSPSGHTSLMAAQILAPLLALVVTDVNTKLEDLADQSGEMFPKFNEPPNAGIAVRSVYPALNSDNPLFTPITVSFPAPLAFSVTLTDFITGTGTWHQKIQLMKRATGKFDSLGNQFVAYLGGMDMNGNRLDNFGRQGTSPYHDVHARITGPAAADVFKTWEERYDYESGINNTTHAHVFPAPEPAALPTNDDARHIIQISRTLFRPATPGTSALNEFAPNGDNSIHQNLLRGIREAREYIYIADQYFVPNETTNGQPEYLNELLEAADHCKRLIVVTPNIMTLPDIPFGHEHRADIVRRLLQRWGSRAIIGAPIRRPVLPPSGAITLEGRCTLYAEATATETELKIGPRFRLPHVKPVWMWINGELMLATDWTDSNEKVDGHPVVTVSVIRGNQGDNPRWGSSTRPHVKGSPVTFSQLKGIFVHAKNMIVDDVFVYIGSGNINRRGFFYDGEMGSFAIPEQLKSAADNPAKALRTEIWAEHLNLPVSMGAALLNDPIAAFELFRRHFYEGARVVPLTIFDYNDDLDLKLSINTNLLATSLINMGMGWLLSERDKIYNTIVDPTTIDDPNIP